VFTGLPREHETERCRQRLAGRREPLHSITPCPAACKPGSSGEQLVQRQ